jgi:HNH endonuclease
MKPFERREDFFILNTFQRLTVTQISFHLRRHTSSVRRRMKWLGVVTPKHISDKAKQIGQFKPGQVPPNKGRKRSEYLSQAAIMKCKRTQFKKGLTPTNHKRIGSQRIDKDGYTWIKYREPNKWMMKHRWLWIQKRGKILPGFVIVFKDGNKNRIVISNLKMISRKQNMMRNTIHNYGKEISKAVQLIGALNRQINKRIKQPKQ